jgi:hypothetical protein
MSRYVNTDRTYSNLWALTGLLTSSVRYLPNSNTNPNRSSREFPCLFSCLAAGRNPPTYRYVGDTQKVNCQAHIDGSQSTWNQFLSFVLNVNASLPKFPCHCEGKNVDLFLLLVNMLRLTWLLMVHSENNARLQFDKIYCDFVELGPWSDFKIKTLRYFTVYVIEYSWIGLERKHVCI